MSRLLVSTALLVLAVEGSAATMPAEPVPRGSARIIGLVAPDFPEGLVLSDSPLEIRLTLSVDDDGHVTRVVVDSTPTPVDGQVRNAVSHWVVVPPVCLGTEWTSKSVRTSIVFSLEQGRQMVTVKDPRWYATGPDEVLREAGTGSATAQRVKMREPLARPFFTYRAIQRNIKTGVVAGVVQFDGQGKATELVRLFQWPARVFESEVERAVMAWAVDSEDEFVRAGKPFKVCFDMTLKSQ